MGGPAGYDDVPFADVLELAPLAPVASRLPLRWGVPAPLLARFAPALARSLARAYAWVASEEG